MQRDVETIDHARSVLGAAAREWPDTLITAPNLPFHPASTYAETHFALACLALALLEPGGHRWLDVAARRLRLWDSHHGPATFFNAMAVCLMRIVLARSGVRHDELEAALAAIVTRTHEHRHVAYGQWSGNNCYLQQVVVDLVLLPLARGELPAPDAPARVAAEFRRFRTAEGFFFDLPREGSEQERLAPPTYVMKILFLVGLCETFSPNPQYAELFDQGMRASLPLFTRHGSFCYFGRTDNSPFAAGLTIFNVRAAATSSAQADFWHAADRADRYFRTFPRTPSGLLQCNRFGGTPDTLELVYSRDVYAKVGEYSVAACAYALLGHWLFPQTNPRRSSDLARTGTAHSADLGVARMTSGKVELLLRVTGEITSWDRRYLAPTVLRFEAGEDLLVGAISRTVSTDRDIRPSEPRSRVQSVLAALRSWYVDGLEQIDGTSVGFVPVVRAGSVDYLPYRIKRIEASEASVEAHYEMLRVPTRGLTACAIELRERLRTRLPWGKRGERGRPRMRLGGSLECIRTVALVDGECRIRDRISGELRGKRVLLSTRGFPGAHIVVTGLEKERSFVGWGSEGRQAIDVYSARADSDSLEYECIVRREPAGPVR